MPGNGGELVQLERRQRTVRLRLIERIDPPVQIVEIPTHAGSPENRSDRVVDMTTGYRLLPRPSREQCIEEEFDVVPEVEGPKRVEAGVPLLECGSGLSRNPFEALTLIARA